MSARAVLATAALAAASVGCAGEPAPAARNFVSCPIVRDTPTVPCWLAEYGGELYYLGIQTDVSAPFHPPLLGHRVLVEGKASAAARICGGIVLDPVHVSPLPELDGTCNTILPAEDRYTVPFAPRPPGPSGGRLAFDPAPGAPAAAAPPPRTGVQEFTLDYDFDTLISGRHSSALTQILDYATSSGSGRIEIVGARGATLLSDGRVLIERADIAQKRAREVASLLARAGATAKLDVSWSTDAPAPDGDEDWRSRRVVVRVVPSR